jgi:adenylate kinase
MRMLLFGPPGVGKGTQADILAQHFKFKKFSMGDVLREEIAKGSELGTKVAPYLNSGTLVPDIIVTDIMHAFIKNNKNMHILFDGFPRTVTQAQHLDDCLSAEHMTLDAAVEMHVRNGEIVKRLVNRRYCPQCGKIYNFITNPPKDDGICDSCKTQLVKRKDDEEDIIRRRLNVYKQETQPLVQYYRSQSVYTRINAEGSQGEVYKEIEKIINAHIAQE